MTAPKSSIKIPNVIEADGETFPVLELLGKGGMGVVYKARSENLDRIVALKMLHENLYADSSAVQRLRREASAAASIMHPNIVHVYRIAMRADTPFIVMEYVDGKPLSDIIDAEEKLAAQKVIDWFAQALDALAAIHDKGFIHRDIKPSNFMVTTDGGIKLSDFGIAKPYADGAAQRLTQTGAMLGSPAYMSPEQCEGGKLDPRSDLYSLGCTMYHALAGRAPFDAESPLELMLKHMHEQATTLDSIGNLALADVVAKAMSKDANDRYQTAEEFKAALVSAANEQRAPSDGSNAKKKRSKRRAPTPPRAVARALLVTTAVLVTAFASYAAFTNMSPQSTAPTKEQPSLVAGSARELIEKTFGYGQLNSIDKLPLAERAPAARGLVAQFDADIKTAKAANRISFAANLMQDRAFLIAKYDPDTAKASLQDALNYIDGMTGGKAADKKLWDQQMQLHGKWLELLEPRVDYKTFTEEIAKMQKLVALRKPYSAADYHQVTAELDRRAANAAFSQRLLPRAEQLAREALQEDKDAGRESEPSYFATASLLVAVLREQGKNHEALSIADREIKRSADAASMSSAPVFVWNARTGIAYHAAATAARMHNSKLCDKYFQISLESAKNAGEGDQKLPLRYVEQSKNYVTLADKAGLVKTVKTAYLLCGTGSVKQCMGADGALTVMSWMLNNGEPQLTYDMGSRLLPEIENDAAQSRFHAHLVIGSACIDLKKLDEAASHLQTAQALRSSEQNLPQMLIVLELQQARLCLARGDIEGARAHFRSGETLYEAAKAANSGMANWFQNEYEVFKTNHGA
jgi:serine/threonine protein kinase